jgi:hypothetical protein
VDAWSWQTERLTERTARAAFDAAAAALPNAPGPGTGTGILIPGGGERYLPGAYVTAGLLRRLGCALPIEIWHLGAREMPARWRALFQRLDARTVDAAHLRRSHPARQLAGFELKAYALVHTEFRRVLLLDADNVPVVDPTFLFDSQPFQAHGAIFWPDYGSRRPGLATGVLSRTHAIWDLTGVAFRGDREFESGQLCVDRQRCFRELVLALWLNMHSDFWYRYLWGDKDTFHLAWRKLQSEWAMPSRGPVDIAGAAMGQCDFEGRVVFQHRNGAKWTLDDNRRVPGFRHEALCLELVAEARQAHPEPR